MKLESILVPVDGSTVAEAALPTALGLSRQTGAHVRLVSIDSGGQRAVDGFDHHAYLDRLAESVAEVLDSPASVSSRVVQGDVVPSLREEAEATADVVVMASHGHGGLTRYWLGSIADAVLHDCPVPVVVVKPDQPASTGLEPRTIDHVVVPLDGTHFAEAAVETGLDCSRLFGARLSLVRVVSPSDSLFSPVVDTPERNAELLRHRESEAREYLESVRSELRDGPGDIDIGVVVNRSPAAGIADFVGERGADLVVVASHRLRGVERAILGSIADKVVRGSSVPVMVVPGVEEPTPGSRDAPGEPQPPAADPHESGERVVYRNVMVPLDGSSLGEAPIPLAVAIARRADAALRMTLVAGHSIPTLEHEEYLDRLMTRIEGEFGCRPSATVREGDVLYNLMEEAGECDADLTVMATHGRSGLSRMWLGSVATRVAQTSRTPLLLVRPDGEAGRATVHPSVTRILVPLDGTRRAEECLPHAVALGEIFGATYHLTRVVEAPTDIPTSTFAPEREAAVRYLEGHAEHLRGQGLEVSTSVHFAHQPGRSILATCAAEECDAIAMATRGWEGLARRFLGSTADKVVRGAETPVLLLGPRVVSRGVGKTENREEHDDRDS